MTEAVASTAAGGESAAPSEAGAPTAGAMIRQARQAAGLHIAALAVSLKVPVAKLEALEADNGQALPDAVFARALAASVCRVLKVDPAPILARLPRGAAPRFAPSDNDGLHSTFRAPSESRRSTVAHGSGHRGGGGKVVRYAVLLLIAGAVAMAFWPQIRGLDWVAERLSGGGTATPGAAEVAPEGADGDSSPQVVVAPVENDAAENAAAAASSAGSLPASALPGSAPAASTATVPVPVPVRPASASVAASAPAPAGSSAAAATPGGLVAFNARGASWVKVVDKAGTVVFQRTLNAGESASASGAVPLKVTVGRADLTDVFVQGQPYVLTAVTRGDGVARFEVK